MVCDRVLLGILLVVAVSPVDAEERAGPRQGMRKFPTLNRTGNSKLDLAPCSPKWPTGLDLYSMLLSYS